MATFNLNTILNRVYGVRGLPFPGKPNTETHSFVAPEFTANVQAKKERSRLGTPLWSTNSLGRPVFLPVKIDGQELPNPLVTITGEKEIIETVIVDAGTVFEKVFTKPYDITIICTLMGSASDDNGSLGAAIMDNTFPESQIIAMQELYVKDKLVTLECALTDIFLQPKNNFIIKSLSLLDMQGIENAQVVQITGRSNLDFELEIE
jgi:hypothetical protein